MRTRTARAGLALAPRDNICRLGERPATVLGGSPRLDRSRIYDRNRGVLDRIGDLADDEPDRDRALFALTGRKLLEVRSAGSLRVASAAQHRADAEQPAPGGQLPGRRHSP